MNDDHWWLRYPRLFRLRSSVRYWSAKARDRAVRLIWCRSGHDWQYEKEFDSCRRCHSMRNGKGQVWLR